MEQENYNLTLSEAWDIAAQFGDFIGENFKYLEYEDALPHSKEKILLALLKILKEEDFKGKFGKKAMEVKEIISSNIVILFTSFIPNKEDYEKLLSTKQ